MKSIDKAPLKNPVLSELQAAQIYYRKVTDRVAAEMWKRSGGKDEWQTKKVEFNRP
ncbi:MAG: hypothetical protein JWR19_2195 [Pedosphaera sp.]|nr:hypothetical protein [Pedosphaera sp.]